MKFLAGLASGVVICTLIMVAILREMFRGSQIS